MTIKKMKLKTQKELYEIHLKKHPMSRNAFEFKERERQEAIRWIKVGQKCGCNGCLHADATFKDFFNITDEELE